MALWPNNRTDILGFNPVGISAYLAFQEVQQRVQRTVAYFGNSGIASTSSIPEGAFQSPACVLTPLVAGGISSANTSPEVSWSQTGNVLAGGPLIGDAAVAWTQSGGLALQVTMAGDGTMTISQSGGLALTIGLTAAGDISITGTGGLSMIVPAAGAASFSLTGAADLKGLLALAGDITPFTELSPENLAAAVWAAVAADSNDAGTMGQKLNLAGSGGVDNDALAAAVWAYVTRTLTSMGTVSANVVQVRGQNLDGTGTESDPWGPA